MEKKTKTELSDASFHWDRVIRRPMPKKKHAILDLCNSKGDIERRGVPKSQGEVYRDVKESFWGDLWPHPRKENRKMRKEKAKKLQEGEKIFNDPKFAAFKDEIQEFEEFEDEEFDDDEFDYKNEGDEFDKNEQEIEGNENFEDIDIEEEKSSEKKKKSKIE